METPATPGAIAAIMLHGDIDDALRRLCVHGVSIGRVALRDLAGIDAVVIARWTDAHAHVMPHGGRAVISAITRAMLDAGLTQHRGTNPRPLHPEAVDDVESLMLDALSVAASPMAIDVLLEQPARWRRWRDEGGGGPIAPSVLDRLIAPPLVVIIGPPNVGKSTLINALAGRDVSLVADEPGSTRDHVGIAVDFAGLVVRCVDAPGMMSLGSGAFIHAENDTPGESVDRQAISISRRIAEHADLRLVCGDADSPPCDDLPRTRNDLTVALRSDLGEASWPHDVAVAAVTGRGLHELVAMVRDRLVPPESIKSTLPWPFWQACATAEGCDPVSNVNRGRDGSGSAPAD